MERKMNGWGLTDSPLCKKCPFDYQCCNQCVKGFTKEEIKANGGCPCDKPDVCRRFLCMEAKIKAIMKEFDI
jgi:hypothetical protein